MFTSIDEYTDQLSVKSQDKELILNINRIGLTLHKLIVRPRDGLPSDGRDILSGPESSKAFKTEGRKFMNQVVGRYANRLPAGHQVQVNDINLPDDQTPGITLDLENNEPCKNDPTRGNCLHSGKEGYDLREFNRISEDSEIVKELVDQALVPKSTGVESVYYHLHSPSGDQGFPEPIDILATITLEMLTPSKENSDENKLKLIGRARFDLKAKISNPHVNPSDFYHLGGTPINLTWHTGYILNDFKAINPDQPGIYQHKLWIDTNDYLEIDQCQLPTGEIKSIDSLGIDFGYDGPSTSTTTSDEDEEIKTIQETMPSTGFDHCFIFRRKKDQEDKLNDERNCKVILTSPKDDLKLKFYTNQDSVQCYSANYFDGLGTRKELHRNQSMLTTQSGYNKHESIYLEFQQPSSLCTNKKLQKNFKEKFFNKNNYDNKFKKDDDSKFCNYTTLLYPNSNQFYHNWFFIDLFN